MNQTHKTRETSTDHLADAADLETITAACGRLTARRGRLDPIAGSLDRELQTVATGAAEARRLLDLAYLAAGGLPSSSPYYPLRAMRPSSETRIAAAVARQEERDHERAAQVERERRHEAIGAASWASRQAGGTPSGSCEGGWGSTGDDDRSPSLHEAAREFAPLPPPSAAHDAPDTYDDHEHHESAEAHGAPLARL